MNSISLAFTLNFFLSISFPKVDIILLFSLKTFLILSTNCVASSSFLAPINVNLDFL
ncbi:hypothetical protein ACSXAB_14580 [Clostridium perfringens]